MEVEERSIVKPLQRHRLFLYFVTVRRQPTAYDAQLVLTKACYEFAVTGEG